MKKRLITVSICAIVVLIAALAAGLNAVFSVHTVDVTFHAFTKSGFDEAAEIQEKLDAFAGESTTFLDLEEVEAVVEEYPSFRVDKIAKVYPQKIALVLTERKETFAVEGENGFSIYDEEGVLVAVKEENVNRVDGGKNVLLQGFELLGDVGATASGYRMRELLDTISAFDEAFGEVRMNLVSVKLVVPLADDVRTEYFEIQTAEGVVIRINNPSYLAKEKGEKAAKAYLALDEEKRAYGTIPVFDYITTGEIPDPVHESD
ncbi:MAG: hypothetical protein J6C93_04805 [Clostridia bacterium]|nr:hypothetical protein [Clostridia bacterium]